MSQQETKQEHRQRYTEILHRVLRWAIPVMGAASIFALLGIILGAINFVGGPVRYPTWLLTIWFVVNIVMVLIVTIHIALYTLLDLENDPNSPLVVLFFFVGIGALGGGGALVGVKHFAWVSLLSLVVLVGFTIIDIILLVRYRQRANE